MVERTGTVIVGAGVHGIQAASRLSREGFGNFIVLEKQFSIGGVWRSFANQSSRVQVGELLYRPRADQVLTNFTPQPELLNEMENVCRQDSISAKMRLGCEVVSVRDLEGKGVEVHYRDASGLEHCLLATDYVLLCTGGLQKPKMFQFSGETSFRGDVILGMGSQIDQAALSGKNVAVLGMGAFAIENARTALLAGAKHVTIVARTLNLIVPRLPTEMFSLAIGTFLYTSVPTAKRSPEEAKSGDDGKGVRAQLKARQKQMIAFLKTAYHYASAEHIMPEFIKNNKLMQVAQELRFPTVSDIFFMALKLGQLDVVHGEVDCFDSEGLQVRTHSSEGSGHQHVPCDVVVKCFGFEAPDGHLAAMVGKEHIRSPLFITERIWNLKVEHNPMLSGSLPSAGTINLGGSAYCMSDLYMEIFMHFRECPEELRDIMGQLPMTRIHEEGYVDMSRGIQLLVDEVPGIAKRIKPVRESYGQRVKRGMVDVLMTNKADWEMDCAALAGGDPHAAPYLWEAMMSALGAALPSSGAGMSKL